MNTSGLLNLLLFSLVGLATAVPIPDSEGTSADRIYSAEDVDLKAIGDTY
ncbi:hypothetical protein ASPVEDRAFT_88296 [Aspergillus versicolor CBS 583.65]|uniref:Uncharacterized protein n=1 Tax=Aspergillus versicolor CBS 583.65 TaxID=1036611 RepID=A0A1L9PZR8_ASPVE|nr:uncharacterized protein ASPVEDRAFT_88296 [Aspergillus versicolor CBS 583.65]OJJ07030.1 hypothetical protein ASPVEDRAFT_88296 [Aspergillus versicolor CBS 583.65]